MRRITEYKSTYGVTSTAGAVAINFEEVTASGKNVGARLFLMKDATSYYQMFNLKNQEFSFTVDVSPVRPQRRAALGGHGRRWRNVKVPGE